MDRLQVLSFGAGVQSTSMFLMSVNGFLKKVDHVIFADTGFEPDYVYKQVERCEKIAKDNDIEFHTVRADFKDSHENIYTHTIEATKGNTSRYSGFPMYMKKGFIRRQCTNDFKIQPIRKKIRELLGLKKGQRARKEILVDQWIGISMDEIQRTRRNRDVWINNYYPLIEKNLNRNDCLNWIKENNLPIPKKSACINCPYHDNKTWLDMKKNRPDDFAKAVEIDYAVREAESLKYPFDVELYTHRSLQPLDKVEFDPNKDQLDMFDEECEGICGI
jgi:3'-phosphoadenosine 5'-phosphosulfate sulfotransferase (PAPS reductase)/FAD synthetase